MREWCWIAGVIRKTLGWISHLNFLKKDNWKGTKSSVFFFRWFWAARTRPVTPKENDVAEFYHVVWWRPFCEGFTHRLDYQPLFGKGAPAPLLPGRNVDQTRVCGGNRASVIWRSSKTTLTAAIINKNILFPCHQWVVLDILLNLVGVVI